MFPARGRFSDHSKIQCEGNTTRDMLVAISSVVRVVCLVSRILVCNVSRKLDIFRTLEYDRARMPRIAFVRDFRTAFPLARNISKNITLKQPDRPFFYYIDIIIDIFFFLDYKFPDIRCPIKS